MYTSSLSTDGQIVSITAAKKTLRFHAVWLRDNAPDKETRSPTNGQRLITFNDVPTDLTISSATINGNKTEVIFQPENKSVSFPIEWLVEHSYERYEKSTTPLIAKHIVTWGADLKSSIPEADLLDLQSDKTALAQWLQAVASHGFAKINNGPIENLALMQVVDLFGYVRETNYGKHFEVRTEVNATNLDYTGMALQAHTDNPYRDPVPTLQILYCLESSTEGGDSLVVDGFRIAELLRNENQAWFDVLSRYCVPFEYSGAQGVRLKAKHPMIELSANGELKAIHFNNRSAATITDVPFDDMPIYYAAYRRMSELIDEPTNSVAFHLQPGESFIVDNTRVLHARTAFSGEGQRWLQGCYADKDGLLSTLASLNSELSSAK